MTPSYNNAILFLLLLQLKYCISSTREQQAFIDALMEESLRSHRVQACDGERVTLHCPRNTHIMVETGFYGRVVPENQLCPGRVPGRKEYYSTCDVIQAQSRLSEICDKKRKCNVYVDATTFDDDPCPSTSKYLQMSYKCKPISFDGESFCAGTQMQLECREGRRLAIYSAAYGRRTLGQAAHCPSPPIHLKRDCVLDVLPAVISKCHAQKGCSLSVSDRVFGSPCEKGALPYLNILFMCLNEEIFSEDAINGELPSLEQYKKTFGDSSNVKEESEQWEKLSDRLDAVESFSKKEHESGSEVDKVTPAAKPIPINNDASYITEDKYSVLNRKQRQEIAEGQTEIVEGNIIGVGNDLMAMARFFKENKEKVLICVVLSSCLGLILLTMACIIHRCCGGSKKDPRVRYSIERSQLIGNNSPYSVLGGPPSLTDMGELDNENFLRYSLTTPPRSSHYDF